ncbi:hypothetical protein [Acaryochloris marina]|uniref:Uncharacterized protein n=1 Tax=Acaryochloris marina (strain MBIC 11017) TaxID=329726 RepID=B0C7L8_ACAM1|nr:hypothetical protein [Acaryochloris marina]ABW25278.1 hypothetical protein AM1_0192 [Acaryochloris marina MBIC11017]
MTQTKNNPRNPQKPINKGLSRIIEGISWDIYSDFGSGVAVGEWRP